LYVINENGVGYDIRSITVAGKAEIKVSKIPLTGRRLGEIDLAFAYGEGVTETRCSSLRMRRARLR